MCYVKYIIAAAVREVLPEHSGIYLSDAFVKAFLSGQLIFYALGLISTIVWNSNRDFKSFFPLRTLFNLFALASVAICSIVIGYDPTLSTIDKSFLAKFSVTIFLLSMALYVFMAVITQVHVNVGKSLSKDDADLGKAVRKSRGLA